MILLENVGIKNEKIKNTNTTKVLEILDFIIGGTPHFYGKFN